MRLRKKWIILSVIVLSIAPACDFLIYGPGYDADLWAALEDQENQTQVARSVQLTLDESSKDAQGSFSDVGADPSGGESEATVDATESFLPTETLSPTQTPQPTLTASASVPMVSVSVDTNCRKGPNPTYDYLGALLVGESAQVLGRLANNQWIVIENPDGGANCWLWLQYATVTGDLNSLPQMTPPPTPTPTFTPTPLHIFHGTWTVQVDGSTYLMTVDQAGLSLTASFSTGDQSVSLNGLIGNNDPNYVSGVWTASPSGAKGSFVWLLKKNTNQFVGHIDQSVPSMMTAEFCGWRSGASVPSPCDGP